MQRLIQVIFLLIITQSNLLSQTLYFFDWETKNAIEGLAVSYSSLSDPPIKTRVTNELGGIQVSQEEFPLVIKTSHLGYEAFSDTLFLPVKSPIYLFPVTFQLNDVIVTGQFSPQSAKNSVFKVQTIDANEIQKRGSLTLVEALSSQLNMGISQDLAIGSSSISLQGISGQNVKILIDGVPLVNIAGNGNGADLSQISLQNIARVEIVEGPMAVNFGANALAGVINLISKKDFKDRTEINASVQTETVGNEYGINEGRHIQSLGINHRFKEALSVVLSAQHNDFLGFKGNARPRQHEWNPKEQWTANGLIKYDFKRHSIHYRFDLLDEVIQDFGIIQNNFLPNGQNQPFAFDEKYKSNRFSHQIQSEGKLSFLDRYTAYAAYSTFERQKSRFASDLISGSKSLTRGEGDQDVSTYNVLELGGNGFLGLGDFNNLQLGYQLSFEEVGGGRIQENKQRIEEYAVYALSEIELSKFSVRSGLRFTYNSSFGAQFIPSLQLKYDPTQSLGLRFSMGKGFRSPSVRELYFEFIDSNHRIFGNQNLSPEKSNHLSLNVLSNYRVASKLVGVDFNIFFNDIEDQIAIGQDINDNTSTTYLNINRFKTLGASVSQNVKIGSLSANLGFSYIGRYNQITESLQDFSSFFYSPELNSNLSYEFLNETFSVNLFYKYTGRIQSYFTETNDINEQVISIGEIDAFHWLDATIVHQINNSFDLTFGARNLFNVKEINNSGISGGAHSGGPNVPVSYGRSYFLKLNYKLNLK